MQSFNLAAGQNCQILRINPGDASRAMFVYRIRIDDGNELDLKIIGDGIPPIIITSKQVHKVIDVATSGNLYLEALGRAGYLIGSYECVG